MQAENKLILFGGSAFVAMLILALVVGKQTPSEQSVSAQKPKPISQAEPKPVTHTIPPTANSNEKIQEPAASIVQKPQALTAETLVFKAEADEKKAGIQAVKPMPDTLVPKAEQAEKKTSIQAVEPVIDSLTFKAGEAEKKPGIQAAEAVADTLHIPVQPYPKMAQPRMDIQVTQAQQQLMSAPTETWSVQQLADNSVLLVPPLQGQAMPAQFVEQIKNSLQSHGWNIQEPAEGHVILWVPEPGKK